VGRQGRDRRGQGQLGNHGGGPVQGLGRPRDGKFSSYSLLPSAQADLHLSQQLIEDLDNANGAFSPPSSAKMLADLFSCSADMQNMGLWQPIVKHLTDADDEVVKRACWVCGTAVQNNPKSQKAVRLFPFLPSSRSSRADLPLHSSSSSTPSLPSPASLRRQLLLLPLAQRRCTAFPRH
jgi:hypothetical protein